VNWRLSGFASSSKAPIRAPEVAIARIRH